MYNFYLTGQFERLQDYKKPVKSELGVWFLFSREMKRNQWKVLLHEDSLTILFHELFIIHDPAIELGVWFLFSREMKRNQWMVLLHEDSLTILFHELFFIHGPATYI